MNRRIGGAGGGSDPDGGAAKKVVAAAIAAGAVAGAGGATGTFSTTTSGASTSETAFSRTVKARKADGKSAARRGDADGAWRKLGMRILRKASKQDLNCITNSFDQIRSFFVHTPCTSLDRTLFAVADGNGGSIAISVAWVGFRDRGDAHRFRSLIDRHGNGDIRPLAANLLGIADVRFTGLNYDSDIQHSRTVVIAETEQIDGTPNSEVLDTLAEVAIFLPAGRHA